MHQTSDSYGHSFMRMRSEGEYYVDKTLLIDDLLRMNDRGVYLFTRPEGFGKTVNISMLDAFFNIEYKGNDWFDGLAISDHHGYDCYRNRFPVIYIDMDRCREPSDVPLHEMFVETISDAFDRHRYLLDSDITRLRVRHLFSSLDDGSVTDDELKISVKDLSEALTGYHGVRPVILIDGYDGPVIGSPDGPEDRGIMNLLGPFMYASVKGNENRQAVIVTGVTDEVMIHSGVDNIMVDDVFSPISYQSFGFTESEVRDLLSYYGRSDGFDEVKCLYGGYGSGDFEIYDPSGVMGFVSGEVMGVRIPRVVRYAIVGALSGRNRGLLEGLKTILDGGCYDGRLKGSLLGTMASFGYLKADPLGEGRYRMTVSNERMRDVLADPVSNRRESVVDVSGNRYQPTKRSIHHGIR